MGKNDYQSKQNKWTQLYIRLVFNDIGQDKREVKRKITLSKFKTQIWNCSSLQEYIFFFF